MTTTKQEVSLMDRPNGDLKAGMYIQITAWCGDKATYKHRSFFGEVEDKEVANTSFFNDVLEVVAVSYPTVLCRVWSATGLTYSSLFTGMSTNATLDAREFECQPASPEFVKALVRKPEPPKPKCLLCRFKAWRRDRKNNNDE